ncbi:MAG: transposase [Acidobacteria bacterium]|nr:transposase [Acidobacteriota bacterium]
MGKELTTLKELLDRSLEDTASLWPDVQSGFALVNQAAEVLRNPRRRRGATVRRTYQLLLRRIRRRTKKNGPLATSLRHFLKVTQSYWPGLFHCYDVPDLPRTNNALEQLFGSTRHHERRCTGRKAASPSLVLRGSVRVIAGLGTRGQCFQGRDLAPQKLEAWRRLRITLEQRRCTRALRYRFRRTPAAYLRQLEALALKRALPP